MMPRFSDRSKSRLLTCENDLIVLFDRVVQRFDCSVICGHRGEEDQNKAFREGKSKLEFPDSLHNRYPSMAVDVVPYPINWNDIHRFYYFAGFVLGTATEMGIKIRWGGDWDRDTQVNDHRFRDLPHFELRKS